ncbi:Aste57867_9580 [Aphanomyces stellatus]|uniref:Aste57867_9580 protein n=1 Tax=Aphanomyces stellatus TaxID=120398 RepID=A0A485KNP2_9STRA|nr:hypothetical protein As57867_009542 [Aphanomyces stellatus]VFT86459.1 Aste57867_9580 [Aphanomyces stellatus]
MGTRGPQRRRKAIVNKPLLEGGRVRVVAPAAIQGLLHDAVLASNSLGIIVCIFDIATKSTSTAPEIRQQLAQGVFRDAVVASQFKIAQWAMMQLAPVDIANMLHSTGDAAMEKTIQARDVGMVLLLQSNSVALDVLASSRALYEDGVYKREYLWLLVRLSNCKQLDQFIDAPSKMHPKQAKSSLVRWLGWLVERHGGHATVNGPLPCPRFGRI